MWEHGQEDSLAGLSSDNDDDLKKFMKTKGQGGGSKEGAPKLKKGTARNNKTLTSTMGWARQRNANAQIPTLDVVPSCKTRRGRGSRGCGRGGTDGRLNYTK